MSALETALVNVDMAIFYVQDVTQIEVARVVEVRVPGDERNGLGCFLFIDSTSNVGFDSTPNFFSTRWIENHYFIFIFKQVRAANDRF